MTTRNFILQYLSTIEEILRGVDPKKLEQIIDVIYRAYREDRNIFLMGNGGGAATAMHFSCDLNKTAIVPGRRRIRAQSLSDNTALVTAWANDTNYTNIFGEQLVNFARPGDLVIGFTASGMSVNIVNGIMLANELGCETIAFVGFDGGSVGAIANHVLHIPSNSYQHIEDVHLTLCHVITNALQERARKDQLLSATGLGDEVQERVRRIYYVRQQLATAPTADLRIQMIPDQLRRTIGFERAMVWIPEDGELVLRAVHGAEREDARLDVEGDFPECEAFRTRAVVSVDDVNGGAPSWLDAYKGVTSYAAVPVVRGDRAVAVLVGGFCSDRTIDQSVLRLLQIFAYNVRGAVDDLPEPANPVPWRTPESDG